jgi:hypothetical protein
VCGPLWPIGDDAGLGEVESGKPGDPPGSPLHYCGRGEGHGFSYLLESHMTYLAGSHIFRSWPGIRLASRSELFFYLTLVLAIILFPYDLLLYVTYNNEIDSMI